MSDVRPPAAHTHAHARAADIAAARASLHARMHALHVLHVRVSTLLFTALENEQCAREEELLHDTNTDPRMARARARYMSNLVHVGEGGERVRPLRSPHVHAVGEPYFRGRDGSTPELDAQAQRMHEVRALLPRPSGATWNEKTDAALHHAVKRVARAAMLRECLAPFGIALPTAALPLGEASEPTLADVGPRAETQYREDAAPALLALVSTAHLTVEQQTELRQRLLDASSASDAETWAFAAPRRCDRLDWMRVAHGGFFPPRSAATPLDCKVRWVSHGWTRRHEAHEDAAGAARRSPTSERLWSSEEDAQLAAAVLAHGDGGWLRVAEVMTHRAPAECFYRHVATHGAGASRAYAAEWTPEEDAALWDAVQSLGTHSWAAVCDELPRPKTSMQAMHRYALLLAERRTARGGAVATWTVEDDVRLRVLHEMYGGDWAAMAVHTPDRSAQALAERWTVALRPEDAHATFTDEEDTRLRAAVAAHGNAWEVVARAFPGREVAHLRMRWHALTSARGRGSRGRRAGMGPAAAATSSSRLEPADS